MRVLDFAVEKFWAHPTLVAFGAAATIVASIAGLSVYVANAQQRERDRAWQIVGENSAGVIVDVRVDLGGWGSWTTTSVRAERYVCLAGGRVSAPIGEPAKLGVARNGGRWLGWRTGRGTFLWVRCLGSAA